MSAGQSLTNAYAVCPDLLTEPRNLPREARLLSALHSWADRFSPSVSKVEPDCLLLDVSGCAHLFGGERGLAGAVQEGLTDLRITAKLGLANTPLAARGFAKFGSEAIMITDAVREHEQVGQLPIEALDVEAATRQTLRRVGLKTIADLSALRSAELARRFGVRLPEALDRLRGRCPDPHVPNAARRVISASRSLPEPVGHLEAITALVESLVERVCRDLVDAGMAARGFRLTVTCPDTGAHDLDIGFATPCRESMPILRQFAQPLEGMKLAFGADALRLYALDAEIFTPVQSDLSDDTARGQASVEQTLTTLGNRFGFDRLRRPVAGRGHTPEDEHGSVEIVDTMPRADATDLRYYPRPELAWDPERVRVEVPGNPPLRFTWKGRTHEAVSADGPERVSPAWWKDGHDGLSSGRVRDYWRVTTDEGRCLWLMTFAGQPRGPRPDWFACGEFLIRPHFEFSPANRLDAPSL